MVLFRGRDGGFAKVYAFRSTQFNVKRLEHEQGVSSSNCQAQFFRTERAGVVYVVVFSSPSLAPFLQPQGAHGGVASA